MTEKKTSRHLRGARRWSPVTLAVHGGWTRDDAPAEVPDEAGMALGEAGDRDQGGQVDDTHGGSCT